MTRRHAGAANRVFVLAPLSAVPVSSLNYIFFSIRARADDGARDADRLFRFLAFAGALLMASTTSIPRRTRPKAANFPSRCGPVADEDKEVCGRAVGLVGARHRDDAALVLDGIRLVRNRAPRSLDERTASDSGSLLKLPPCITKSLTTRLKVVVSKAPVAARLRKLRTVSGADSGSISISMTPASVSSVTHCAAIFSIVAPSKGSAAFASASAGRSLLFFGTGAFLQPSAAQAWFAPTRHT